jgi:hypothetical protein
VSKPRKHTHTLVGRCRCGRVWDSITQCHCSTCHRQFSGISAFDKHRVPPLSGDRSLRVCADPALLGLTPSVESFGVVWRRDKAQGPWWKRSHVLPTSPQTDENGRAYTRTRAGR